MDSNKSEGSTSEQAASVSDDQRVQQQWQLQLQPESRQRIVNKILDSLKRHLQFQGQEGLNELWNSAVRFEEKIYTSAASQSDYLRRISLKLLSLEKQPETICIDAKRKRVMAP